MLARLANVSTPWVVENVPEALPTWDYLLCGTSFGLRVKRHRGFRRGNWDGYSLLSPCQCYPETRTSCRSCTRTSVPTPTPWAAPG